MDNNLIIEFGKAIGKKWEILKLNDIEIVIKKNYVSHNDDNDDDIIKEKQIFEHDLKLFAFDWMEENYIRIVILNDNDIPGSIKEYQACIGLHSARGKTLLEAVMKLAIEVNKNGK